MLIKDKLINYFGKNIKEIFLKIEEVEFEEIDEIRIRLEKGIVFRRGNEEKFLYKDASLKKFFNRQALYIPSEEDISQTLQAMSEYSIYALEQEIKNGFLTLNGGFRVGIVGRAVIEDEKIKTIRNISSLNLRIAKEIKGCSRKIMPYILDNELKSTIIISSPNCGKTTMLRDIVKNISDEGYNVGLVDERSEIAGSYMGKPQLDVGIRTDVYDRCKKTQGMLLLLRSMAPDIIAVDEIGQEDDVLAIEKIANSGVKLICTAHSFDIKDFMQKVSMDRLIKKQIFKRFIVLKRENNKPIVDKIYNENFKEIYSGGKICI